MFLSKIKTLKLYQYMFYLKVVFLEKRVKKFLNHVRNFNDLVVALKVSFNSKKELQISLNLSKK